MFPQLSNDHRFAFFLLLVAMFAALFWWWNRGAKKWLEGRDRAKKSLNTAERLEGEPRRRAAAPLRYSEQEFQEMVASALDEVAFGPDPLSEAKEQAVLGQEPAHNRKPALKVDRA